MILTNCKCRVRHYDFYHLKGNVLCYAVSGKYSTCYFFCDNIRLHHELAALNVEPYTTDTK